MDYLALQTNHLVEFSHGTVGVLPVPTDKHQSIVAYLFTLFAVLATEVDGKVLFARFRLQLWPGTFRVPDLIFLRAADDPRRSDQYWTGADIVVEVVSPDDPKRDIVTKRDEYAKADISEYWIVDAQEETITVLRLASDGCAEHGRFTRGVTATSALRSNFAVDVSTALDAA